MRILRFFIFIFLKFQLIHALDFNCPNSNCGSTYSIKHPFKLQDQHPQICSNYINLTCTPQNITVLNIPFSGDFHVVSIDYFARSITLRDPHNCLANRLINLNLSSSPFTAEYSRKYTFYNCPIKKLIYAYDLTTLDCLNISPNVTVASSEDSYEEMKKTFGCTENVTKEIPVAWYVGEYDTFSNLRLKWYVPICEDCDEFYPHKQDESKKTHNLIAIVTLIPLVIIVAFLVASYKRDANARASRATPSEAAQPQQTVTATTTTAVLLGSVEDIMASHGQYSMLKTTNFSAFLEGNSDSLEDQDQGSCCTICLEEFSPQDIIRCLTSCRHYFHSRCIDQWFQDNSSCPICRNSIFDV